MRVLTREIPVAGGDVFRGQVTSWYRCRFSLTGIGWYMICWAGGEPNGNEWMVIRIRG